MRVCVANIPLPCVVEIKHKNRNSCNNTEVYTLIFLLTVFNKGTKLVGEQDNVDNCQKTQTVVSPIKPNIDLNQKQQKSKSVNDLWSLFSFF